MAENHVLLSRQTLSQSAASVTFSNIPQSGYTDLKIVVSARTDDANTGTIAYIKFNGSSSTYSSRYLQGRGDSTASGTGSTSYGEIGRIPGVNSPVTNNVYSNTEITIPNYLSSNNKSYSVDGVTEANQTIAYAILTAGLWSTSSAITSILVASSAGNLVSGSTFSLYGIAAVGTTPVIAPFATGGDIITNDGTYWYHAFLSTGTFTPQKAMSCDALVVAGGGSGAYSSPGGGGAGGLLGFTSQSLTATGYTVTVGAGGAASGTGAVNGNNGSNSTFGSLTTVIGGGAGGSTANAGGNGGSGGGAGQNSGTGGTATSGQGFNGGGNNGGGGGAGAAGATGYGAGGSGIGGVGSSAYSSWGLATSTGQNVSGTVYYAGGGGGYGSGPAGAAGGYGGGGAGGSATAGAVNTGGASGADSNRAGGSGIVIIRYSMV